MSSARWQDKQDQFDSTIKRLCVIAHIVGPRLETCSLYPIKRSRRNCVQRDAWFVSRKNAKTSETQVAEEKNESNNNDGSGSDCLGG